MMDSTYADIPMLNMSLKYAMESILDDDSFWKAVNHYEKQK